MKACGWSQERAAEMFGLKHRGTIARWIKGAKWKARHVIRLRELEGRYEHKLEGWRTGAIGFFHGSTRRRFDFLVEEGRPSDLAALGVVEDEAEDASFFGEFEYPPRAPRAGVSTFAGSGLDSPKNSELASGQPPDFDGRPRGTSADGT
jgi:hypothetical protein